MDNQLFMLVEEVGELLQAINKYRRHRGCDSINSLAEEIGDVENMLGEIKFILKIESLVRYHRRMKLIKLSKLLSSKRGSHGKK
jgi:NTP pyrophosphatase (non-canonical NTP hydrolase)